MSTGQTKTFLINEFPDFNSPGFNLPEYNRQFEEANGVIAASAKNISYSRHWGPLSVKSTLSGNEYYQTGNTQYTANNTNFLVLNSGTEYSSFIDSDKVVKSYTINFCDSFIKSCLLGIEESHENLLEQKENEFHCNVHFVEKTYSKEDKINSVLMHIYSLLSDFEENRNTILELYHELFSQLLSLNKNLQGELNEMKYAKYSTRIELYKRLSYSKDYIESCYDSNISLDEISNIACLNREYFIRQFKYFFKITPIQYLINKRMEAAKELLARNDISISEVCQMVGYSDLSSFGKLFKKYYKISPENYRVQKNIRRNNLISL